MRLDVSGTGVTTGCQIAHVYADDNTLSDARTALTSLDGVGTILDDDGKHEREIDHSDAGDLVPIADRSAWFQYYWWREHDDAPPYATEMNIHAKSGFDPCELFFGEMGLVSLDPSQVGGSHGRVDDDALAIFSLGGSAAGSVSLPEAIDARAPLLRLSQTYSGSTSPRTTDDALARATASLNDSPPPLR